MQRDRTYISIKRRCRSELPERFAGQDIRFCEEMVEYFIDRFTKEGGVVFDPFAGFGTALVAAENTGRSGYGIEFLEERVEYARTVISAPERLLHGDSRKLSTYELPRFDLAITSPPYPFMGRDTDADPLSAYTTPGNGYDEYIRGLADIFRQMRPLMNPGARIVIEAGNLALPGGITTLAWDIAGAVSRVLDFQGETVICWDIPGHGYDHTYCLVFSG